MPSHGEETRRHRQATKPGGGVDIGLLVQQPRVRRGAQVHTLGVEGAELPGGDEMLTYVCPPTRKPTGVRFGICCGASRRHVRPARSSCATKGDASKKPRVGRLLPTRVTKR